MNQTLNSLNILSIETKTVKNDRQ